MVYCDTSGYSSDLSSQYQYHWDDIFGSDGYLLDHGPGKNGGK